MPSEEKEAAAEVDSSKGEKIDVEEEEDDFDLNNYKSNRKGPNINVKKTD